jgi:Prohead core protein serine protease
LKIIRYSNSIRKKYKNKPLIKRLGVFLFISHIYIYKTTTMDKEIKLLKRGQSGYGVLIEHDAGFISPDEPRNQPFINEIKKLDTGTKLAIMEPLIVYVVLQKYGILNRNGRIYPEQILKSQDKLYQQAIRERRAVGELDHPESSVIAGDRISHNIVETWWEGHTLMGKMEILMTPGFINYGIVSTKGDEVANLLRNRIKIGVSSRGVGSLKESRNGEQIVQDDFEIICWDVVTAPSTPDAWIGKSHEEMRPYVENTEIKKPLMKESLVDKLDKFLID